MKELKNRKVSFKSMLGSLSFKLVASIYIILIPIIILLIYSNYQSRNTLMQQVEGARESLLRSYIDQVDAQLENSAAFSWRLAMSDTDVVQAAFSRNEASIQYARIRLQATLSDKAQANNLIDGYFVQLDDSRGNSTFLTAADSSADGGDRARVQAYMLEHAAEMVGDPYKDDTTWQECTLDGTGYLIQMVKFQDAVVAGGYVNLDRLQRRLAGVGADMGLRCLPAGAVEGLSGGLEEGERLIAQTSERAPYALVEVVQQEVILDKLPFMQRYTQLATLFILLTIPLLFLLVYNIVTRPLMRLMGAMREIQKGNLDYRIQPYRTSTEIRVVNECFNNMIEQVQSLKIGIYEEELRSQRAQLRNLQLQIRPHFLINALNMLYNAVESGDLTLARQLILHSVDYFRYMVKVDEDLVSLQEEIAHVRTYLEIQSIRYMNRFSYNIEVDRLVEDMLVPPLMVQSFVENSMKYAIRLTEDVRIDIRVEAYEVDYQPYGRITIADTGPGYPPELLEKLNNNQPIAGGKGYIGVRNVVRRLEIFFGKQAGWRFYNDGGAVSSFTLPARFAQEGEENSAEEKNANVGN